MKTKITNVTNKVAKKLTKENVGKFLNRYGATIAMCALVVIMVVGQVYADEAADGGTADTLWTQIADLMKTWVTRLGAVVMFVGGVMFGLGWKNDDADGKTRGINTIIAGAIVVAVAGLTSTFFA